MTAAVTEGGTSGLKFRKSIISTVKEPISTKELLVRLRSLSDELSVVDQDSADSKSFKKIQSDLVNKKLLNHVNIGVQSYVCCCISDILRINAPNAPFTASELSQIFKAFFRQFRKLSDQENPYFHQQCYLLKRLAEVRSIILITDLPDAENLIDLIFDTFYDLSNRDFPKKLETLISDVLSEIISESEIIPTKVLRIILDKFQSESLESISAASGSKSNIYNPALNFSILICEANLDRMSRLVAQYFSEQLYESSNRVDLGNDEKNTNITKQDKQQHDRALTTLSKIHRLSVQIWKYIPELLSSVMGLIDDELNADDENIRILSTETIGKIVGSSNLASTSYTTKVNFVITHKEVWNNWLKKTTDVSPKVRRKWIEQFANIINSSNSSTSEINGSLSKCLYKCLLDTDEKVRLAACKTIQDIPFESFSNKVCSKEIMITLSHLTREKNIEIRNQAIKIFGNLYDCTVKALANCQVVNFGNHDEKESQELQKLILESIPNQILSLVYINDRNINSLVDLCIFEKLLPVAENNSIKRVSRLLSFYRYLDEKGKKSFIAMNKRQQQVAKVLQTFIGVSENYNKIKNVTENKENSDATISSFDKNYESEDKQSLLLKIDKIIKWICVSFPDGLNTYACFERFLKLNKARYFHLLKICISPESDYNTVRNSMKELLTKLSDSKNIRLEDDRSHISSSDMVANFKLLLLRSSVLLYNKSNVVELINYSKDLRHESNAVSNEILEHISVTIPEVFKFHIKALTKLIVDYGNNEDENERNFVAQTNNLKTIFHFIKKFSDLYPSDINFTEALKSISIYGTPQEARYAMKILGLSDKKELYCSAILNSIYPLNLEHKNFVSHLSTIAQIYLIDPVSMEDKSSELTSLLIKEIFLRNRSIDRNSTENENEWLTDFDLDRNFEKHATLYEKILAMRILINKLRAFEQNGKNLNDHEKEELSEQAQPIFKLLVSFIGNRGEIINKKLPTWPTPEVYKSKLRLTAGYFILKLAKYPVFNEMIFSTTLRRLTFLLTDSNIHVRSEFMAKLQKSLINDSISERFLSIVFFCASEDSPELKNSSIMWIKSLHKRREAKNNINLEKSLVRIIHILAHHEQFIALVEEEESNENLLLAYSYASKFIIFFITLVAKVENISLLYYFASRVKQHRDATLPAELYQADTVPKEALNLYRISELSQLIIKEYSDSKNWPMQTWPGKLKLPSDIYVQMESAKEVQNVITSVFIPDAIQIELSKSIKKRFAKGHKKTSEMNVGDQKIKKNVIRAPTSAVSKRKKNSRLSNSKKKPKHIAIDITEPTRKSSRQMKKINYVEEQDSESETSASESYSD